MTPFPCAQRLCRRISGRRSGVGPAPRRRADADVVASTEMLIKPAAPLEPAALKFLVLRRSES